MPETWKFEHSIECQAGRDFAWQFWTNVANWAAVDPAVEAVELDGPFVVGAKGVTKQRGGAPVEWRVVEVEDRRRALIEAPAPGAVLRCLMIFEDSPNDGTRITQRMNVSKASGPKSTRRARQRWRRICPTACGSSPGR